MTKILVTGASGRMGQETIKAILNEPELSLVGAIDVSNESVDIGLIIGNKEIGIKIQSNLEEALDILRPDVLVDFTSANVSYKILSQALSKGCGVITGTTGFTEEQIASLKEIAEKNNANILIVPNFAIGAVLMMKFSQEAGKYFQNVEIVEMHHENKKDSPSGTAIKTAEMILKNSKNFNEGLPESIENIKHCRGGKVGNINIHSIRLPGFVASQEVIFGGLGQTLTITHQTINRESFMPGVVFAIKQFNKVNGFVYGLENLL